MSDRRTPEQRLRTAHIRQVARDQLGLEVSDRGALPAAVVAAVEAFEGSQGGGDTGPDWEMAGTILDAGDPLTGLESPSPPQEPGSEGQAAAPAAPGPPPPASLDEARERIGAAGKTRRPAWAKRDSSKTRAGPPRPVTAAVRGDITGKVTLLLMAPAAAWSQMDPYCGGAFAANLDNIINKAVPLICQSPKAVEWLTKSTGWMLAVDLCVALQPVAAAAWHHHVLADVMVLPDGRTVPAIRLADGRVVPARRLPNGQLVPADPTAPGTPPEQPDLSMYTTEVNGHVPPVPA